MTSGVTLRFAGSLTPSDPKKNPVTIIGQLRHLQRLGYEDVRIKLEPRVSEEVYLSALGSMQDVCPLYLHQATLTTLPSKCSRHNTPSRCHALTKIVRNCSNGYSGSGTEYIVVICERSDVLASACAVARAFPLFSRKTGLNPPEHDRRVSVEFILVGSNNTPPLSEEETDCLHYCAYGVQVAARIVDTPANEMNTEDFIKEIQKVARYLGYTPVIIRGEDLLRRGFGGIFGVGKAAVSPPALVVLSHFVSQADQTIAWVGKGIVYDTGGLSMKTKTSMLGMKRDCGGAAAILGAFYTAVKLGFQQNLHAVFCLAENAVGPIATRPDDIHMLYSGRTVEINNTDAEGRLVLADGVAYAQRDLKANVIVDMATLTGAQGIATGKYHGALLTNNEDWERRAIIAGRSSGDLLFPIPFCPELHFSEFASTVADMKNSVADRSNAQPSCAGLFVGAHLGFDFPGSWLHIDMASPVHCGERSTGYGVALLNVLFGEWSENVMLRQLKPQSASAPASLSLPRGSNGEPQDSFQTDQVDVKLETDDGQPSDAGNTFKKMRKM